MRSLNHLEPRLDPGSYRSVSLIPLFGKVLEKVAYFSLLRHVMPAISSEQHGFVPGRFCATNLASLLSTAYESIGEQGQTDCIYLHRFFGRVLERQPSALSPQTDNVLPCNRPSSKMANFVPRQQTARRGKWPVLGVESSHVGHTRGGGRCLPGCSFLPTTPKFSVK